MRNFISYLINVYNAPIVIMVLFNIANVFNLIFQIYASKKLNFYDFSLFYSTISFIFIFLGPFASISLFIQQNAKRQSKQFLENFFSFCFYLFIFLQIIILIFFLLYFQKIKIKFKSDDDIFFILAFVLHFLNMLLIIPGGLLYAEEKYKYVHVIFTFFDGIRLLGLFIFIDYFEKDLYFLISLNILYTLLCLIFLYNKISFKINFFGKIKEFYYDFKKYFKVFIKFFIYSSTIPLIYQIDIIFVKFYFSDHSSSSYIVISSIAKTIYIIPAVLNNYFFDLVLIKNYKKLFYNLILFLTIIFFAYFFLLFTKEHLISFLYDKKYLLSIDSFVYILTGFTLLAISNFCFQFFLARKNFTFLIYLVFCIIIYITLNINFNSEVVFIARNFLISVSLLFIFSILNLILLRKKIFIDNEKK